MRSISSWDEIDWPTEQRSVDSIGVRIRAAVRDRDWSRVSKLQRLQFVSRSAALLAVKRAAQENRGKRTPGVDGKANLTSAEKLELALGLSSDVYDDALLLRRKRKRSGEYRDLRVPTIRVRAQQWLVKLCIEPTVVDGFDPQLYGSMPGRSIYDALVDIAEYLHEGPMYVALADIKDFYVTVPWDLAMGCLRLTPRLRELVERWLLAPTNTPEGLVPPTQGLGLAQGSAISPLLAHLTLQGLQDYVYNQFSANSRPLLVVYVDDIAILARTKADVEEALMHVRAWLATRGYQLNEAKTSGSNGQTITSTAECLPGEDGGGFEYLGVHFLQFPVDPEVEATRQAIEEGYELLDANDVPIPVPPSKGWDTYLTVRGARGREYGSVNVAVLRARIGDLGIAKTEDGTQMWY